jgi:hypothetical protein
VGVPWSEGGYAAFHFSAFAVSDFDAPAFYYALDSFAFAYCYYVEVLAFFEYVCDVYGFT